MTTARPLGTTGYDKDAPALLATRLSFDEVHRHVIQLLPASPGRILDLGSGPGHDAATLAGRGYAVTAVEPTPELRDGAKALYRDLPIDWVDDSLTRTAAEPFLPSTCVASSFDFILVEGVWAHLTEAEHVEAFPVLTRLLADNGVLAISLRHGPAAPGRITYPVTATATAALAKACGLTTLVKLETGSIQAANITSGVTWTRMAFGRATLGQNTHKWDFPRAFSVMLKGT